MCVCVCFSTVCGQMVWMLFWGRRWPVNSLALTWTLFWTWRWSSASWIWRTSRFQRPRPLSQKNPVIMTLSMTATKALHWTKLFFTFRLEGKKKNLRNKNKQRIDFYFFLSLNAFFKLQYFSVSLSKSQSVLRVCDMSHMVGSSGPEPAPPKNFG